MTKKGNKESSLAPFLTKCYEMVDDDTTDGIISWGQSIDTFVIWDLTDFTTNLLPKFFKHSNFSSFMRQLNIYGFRKTDTDRWEFTNEWFMKGEKHLLKNIKRRKNIQGSTPKKSQPDQTIEFSDEVDYFNLEKEVEILKTGKLALMEELSNVRERQEISQNKLLLLRERLQGMENSQQQLLSFLVMVLQTPGLLDQLLKPKENNRRRNKSGKFTLDKETGYESAVVPDGSIVRYQPMSNEEPSTLSPSLKDSEAKLEHDFSFNGIEDLFMNFNFPTPKLDESFPFGSTPPVLDIEKLEQFLLSSPTRDCVEESHLDDDDDDDQTLESEMETDSPSLEVLTARMGCLSPGSKIAETRQLN